MTRRFLDTNVLLRYFTRDDEDKAERVRALLTRVDRGEEKVTTSPLVMFEVVFTLQSFYGVERRRIRDLLAPVISMRGLELGLKGVFDQALDLYAGTSVSFADAYNAAHMKWRGASEIYTWDTDFDQLGDIVRVEP
jgi:predicted nucleic acid-binding protein